MDVRPVRAHPARRSKLRGRKGAQISTSVRTRARARSHTIVRSTAPVAPIRSLTATYVIVQRTMIATILLVSVIRVRALAKATHVQGAANPSVIGAMATTTVRILSSSAIMSTRTQISATLIMPRTKRSSRSTESRSVTVRILIVRTNSLPRSAMQMRTMITVCISISGTSSAMGKPQRILNRSIRRTCMERSVVEVGVVVVAVKRIVVRLAVILVFAAVVKGIGVCPVPDASRVIDRMGLDTCVLDLRSGCHV